VPSPRAHSIGAGRPARCAVPALHSRSLLCSATLLFFATLFFATLFFATPARAALGGNAASIQADQVHLQGSRRLVAAGNYTVHEILAPTGTVVREYVSADGKVFAVAWNGPFLPDMRQLLGDYFDRYARAVQVQSNARMGRRPVMIDQPELVVRMGGHMRAWAGKAYVPNMVPPGVQVEDIQ
jgi:hypothetical protein